MIIDAHQHVFWHGQDAAGLVADMDANGVDKAWILTWEIHPTENDSRYFGAVNPQHLRPDGTHPGLVFDDVLRAKRQFPERFIVGYAPHPLYGDVATHFESAYRIHGVRVCGEWKCRLPLDDPRCIELFRKAGQLGCPVVFHIDIPWRREAKDGPMKYQPNWYGGTIENLKRTLAACPETNFIGHAPGLWREVSGSADDEIGAYPSGPVTPGGRLHPVLEEYDNMYIDLSAGSGFNAMNRDHDHAREFLTRFADKVLFGRDCYSWMIREPKGLDMQDLLNQLDIGEDVREKIFYRNAEKLLPAE